MSVELVPSRKEDKELLRTIHHTVYREVVERQFGKWDKTQQDGFFDNGWHESKYQLILSNKNIIGVLSILDKEDHIFFAEIQILPEFQGQGIGSTLIKDLLKQAKQKKRTVKLQVLKENKEAEKLYSRLGFKKTDTTEFHNLMEYKVI